MVYDVSDAIESSSAKNIQNGEVQNCGLPERQLLVDIFYKAVICFHIRCDPAINYVIK